MADISRRTLLGFGAQHRRRRWHRIAGRLRDRNDLQHRRHGRIKLLANYMPFGGVAPDCPALPNGTGRASTATAPSR